MEVRRQIILPGEDYIYYRFLQQARLYRHLQKLLKHRDSIST